MIRICLFADGQSIHTKRWCKYFTEQGYEIHLITFRDTEIPDVTVHFVNCGTINVAGNNKKILLKIPQVRKLVRKINPDIVHSHYATSYGIAGALCGKRPYIVTPLGSDILISPSRSLLYKWLLRFVFKKADWITAMSDPMKETMISLGADEKKISLVIFGIDPKIFNSTGRIDFDDPFTIISTRNFEPLYNIDVFIKAIAILKHRIPGIFVHLVGSGSMESLIKNLITDLGLEKVIHFHGRISQDRIAGLLKQSHIFVSLSNSDGNNISLNEAMSCGCLNVVSDIPANRQWIHHGINGFFCKRIMENDVADAVFQAYQSYSKIIGPARELSKTLINERAIWSVNMQKVIAIYNKFIPHEK